jgi:hypothetical protein
MEVLEHTCLCCLLKDVRYFSGNVYWMEEEHEFELVGQDLPEEERFGTYRVYFWDEVPA